jgi:4-hydroxy-tetrahydrodipicolinate synthase
MAAGAVGVISVASNLIPREVGDLVRAALGGDYEEARRLHLHWYPLFKDLFLDPNPVPIKYALSLLGRMHPDVRLPLCEISSATAAKLEASLRKLNILR